MRSLIRRPAPAASDPAPSRIAYRLHRLWLTPLFRAFLRVGLPAFLAVFALGHWISNPANRQAIADTYADLLRSVEQRPEFMVKLMAIDGASPEVAGAIRDMMPVHFPVSSFDLDLTAAKDLIAGLDAIDRVDLHVRAGGILQVQVTEREPAVVWRGPGGLDLLDATGHRIASLPERAGRPDLPLIVGAGADRAVPEALKLYAAARPVADRLRGLVRLGERRWDAVLVGGQRILLPEDGAVAALERVLALDVAQDLLARDLVAVDFRNTRRPTLRLAPSAVSELARIRSIQSGVPIR